MSRAVSYALFISTAVAILVGAHYYLWLRLVRDTALPLPWRPLATYAIVALGLAMPLAMAESRLIGSSYLQALVWIAFVWMGLMFLLVLFFGITDIGRLVAGAGGRLLAAAEPVDLERRLTLQRLLGGSALAVVGVSAVAGFRAATRVPQVKRLTLRLERLPQAMDGTTIVQISDLHIGPTIKGDWLAQVVARVNELSADVVAITGDLVDGSVGELGRHTACLADLKARHGSYFVTGNHEYYSGVEQWEAEIQRLGVRVLRNERVTIGDGEASYELAGIDDPTGRHMAEGHGPNLERALAGLAAEREVVLLAHQPVAIYEAAKRGVGLQLSGHTHGGQIWPWGYLVRFQQPFVQGLATYGPTQIYVSRGTGYWGPPMRLGAPAEITLIELRRA